jgi:hypothetical protein
MRLILGAIPAKGDILEMTTLTFASSAKMEEPFSAAISVPNLSTCTAFLRSLLSKPRNPTKISCVTNASKWSFSEGNVLKADDIRSMKEKNWRERQRKRKTRISKRGWNTNIWLPRAKTLANWSSYSMMLGCV